MIVPASLGAGPASATRPFFNREYLCWIKLQLWTVLKGYAGTKLRITISILLKSSSAGSDSKSSAFDFPIARMQRFGQLIGFVRFFTESQVGNWTAALGPRLHESYGRYLPTKASQEHDIAYKRSREAGPKCWEAQHKGPHGTFSD